MKGKFRSKLLYFFPLIFLMACTMLFAACNEQEEKPETLLYKLVYQAGEGGSINGESEQRILEGENGVSVTAVPNEGYEFDKWTDGITTATRQDTDVRNDLTVTAFFQKKTYTVSYKAAENGTLKGEPSQTVAHGESAKSVTAVPNKGYVFDKWSDGVKSAIRTDKNVQESFSVIATFRKKIYKVRYETDGSGSIQGEANQTIEHYGNASSVTAIPNEGYEFDKWSDGFTSATRQDANIIDNTWLTAYFKKKTYTVKYIVYGTGVIVGEEVQKVKSGEDAAPVTAESRYGEVGYAVYRPKFLYWSDGLENATRQEKNVVRDLEITAYFGCEVTYAVDGKGGTLSGETSQRLKEGDQGKPVIAIPDAGYVFTGWSDLSFEEEHRAKGIDGQSNGTDKYEYIAYFEPIQKNFIYDYGSEYHVPSVNTIEIKRDEIRNVKFIVPQMADYTFWGWYADPEFKVRVSDEEGRLFTGYQTFLLESSRLYARWIKDNEPETIPTYKILLIMTDEIHVRMYSKVTQGDVDFDYKMSGIERRLLATVPSWVSGYLNEWFEGKVKFEVDVFFTVDPWGAENARLKKEELINRYTDHKAIPAIPNLHSHYHSVLSTYSLNDYDFLVNERNVGGSALCKYGNIHLESIIDLYLPYTSLPTLPSFYDLLRSHTEVHATKVFIGVYLHELTHTIELNYLQDEIFEYHKACGIINDPSGIEDSKKYLLQQIRVDGKYVGVPPEFWRHEVEVKAGYHAATVDKKRAGKIIAVGELDDRPKWENSITRRLQYGADLIVEAVPYDGYRFVQWTDGVKTARRHDRNIISLIYVYAIFEKI